MRKRSLDMESITLEKFIDERIQENKESFSQEEMEWIEKNKKCMKKIYLLGAINALDSYFKD